MDSVPEPTTAGGTGIEETETDTRDVAKTATEQLDSTTLIPTGEQPDTESAQTSTVEEGADRTAEEQAGDRTEDAYPITDEINGERVGEEFTPEHIGNVSETQLNRLTLTLDAVESGYSHHTLYRDNQQIGGIVRGEITEGGLTPGEIVTSAGGTQQRTVTGRYVQYYASAPQRTKAEAEALSTNDRLHTFDEYWWSDDTADIGDAYFPTFNTLEQLLNFLDSAEQVGDTTPAAEIVNHLQTTEMTGEQPIQRGLGGYTYNIGTDMGVGYQYNSENKTIKIRLNKFARGDSPQFVIEDEISHTEPVQFLGDTTVKAAVENYLRSLSENDIQQAIEEGVDPLAIDEPETEGQPDTTPQARLENTILETLRNDGTIPNNTVFLRSQTRRMAVETTIHRKRRMMFSM